MKRVRLVISGDVVGVGFRAWVRRVAADNHLTGWVKNRQDRTVEVVAEGEKEALEKFLAACKKGPDLPAIAALRRWQAGVAWVEDVNITWLSATGEFLNFSVVY